MWIDLQRTIETGKWLLAVCEGSSIGKSNDNPSRSLLCAIRRRSKNCVPPNFHSVVGKMMSTVLVVSFHSATKIFTSKRIIFTLETDSVLPAKIGPLSLSEVFKPLNQRMRVRARGMYHSTIWHLHIYNYHSPFEESSCWIMSVTQNGKQWNIAASKRTFT